jgi:hypothetical protein
MVVFSRIQKQEGKREIHVSPREGVWLGEYYAARVAIESRKWTVGAREIDGRMSSLIQYSTGVRSGTLA